MKYIFFIITLMTALCKAYNPTTSEVANRLGYPALTAGLRNEIQDFITNKRINTMLNTQELRAQNFDYQADDLTELYKEERMDIEDKFDLEFDRISEKFVVRGQQLDDEDATEEKKAAFIKALAQELQRSISALLDDYKNRERRA